MQVTRRQQGSALPILGAPGPRVLASLSEHSVTWVWRPVSPHRSVLDSKENDLKAVLQELESERMKERALQSQLEEEQLQHLQREGQSSKTLEVTGQQGWAPGHASQLVATRTRKQLSSSVPIILVCDGVPR